MFDLSHGQSHYRIIPNGDNLNMSRQVVQLAERPSRQRFRRVVAVLPRGMTVKFAFILCLLVLIGCAAKPPKPSESDADREARYAAQFESWTIACENSGYVRGTAEHLTCLNDLLLQEINLRRSLIPKSPAYLPPPEPYIPPRTTRCRFVGNEVVCEESRF